MSDRDWRRYEDREDSAEGAEGGERREAEFAPSEQEMRQLLLEETVTRAKAAELSQFRHFEQEGASDDEWRLLLMECSPTIH
jgi:hypothetical protein